MRNIISFIYGSLFIICGLITMSAAYYIIDNILYSICTFISGITCTSGGIFTWYTQIQNYKDRKDEFNKK